MSVRPWNEAFVVIAFVTYNEQVRVSMCFCHELKMKEKKE